MKQVPSDASPVGIFDSGLGGLTVLSAIRRQLPAENLIYFGDTARIPYGSKSRETIVRYSEELLQFLLEKDVKTIVVACNTASSYALERLRSMSPVPVIGVVEPGVQALLRDHPQLSRAAVLATRSTVRSESYQSLAANLSPGLFLYARACPLFVPLIEEGFVNKKVTEDIVHEYVDEIDREQIQHVILGCTHYPLLKALLQRMYPHFSFVDSSVETARELYEKLAAAELVNQQAEYGEVDIYVSDITESLHELEQLFLGGSIHRMHKVTLGW